MPVVVVGANGINNHRYILFTSSILLQKILGKIGRQSPVILLDLAGNLVGKNRMR